MRKKIIYYFGLLFLFFIFQGTLISLNAGPEEELMELLAKKHCHRLDKAEEEKIPALHRDIETSYLKRSLRKDPDADLMSNLWTEIEKSPKGFIQLRERADLGHTHSQYLSGLYLTHCNENKAFDFLSLAAGKGHQSAFDLLLLHANQHKNPHAIFELGKVYIDKGDNLAAAECLKRSLIYPSLFRNPRLTKGFILYLQGDFSGALKFYRRAENGDLAYRFMYGNSDFLIQCIKNKLYESSELKIAEEQLIEFAKADKDLLPEIKELSKVNPSFLSVYMTVVTRPAQRRPKKVGLKSNSSVPGLSRQRSQSQSLIHVVKDEDKGSAAKQKAYSADCSVSSMDKL